MAKRCSTLAARVPSLRGGGQRTVFRHVLRPECGWEARRLGYRAHLLVAGVLYAVLAEVGEIRTGHDGTRDNYRFLQDGNRARRPAVYTGLQSRRSRSWRVHPKPVSLHFEAPSATPRVAPPIARISPSVPPLSAALILRPANSAYSRSASVPAKKRPTLWLPPPSFQTRRTGRRRGRLLRWKRARRGGGDAGVSGWGDGRGTSPSWERRGCARRRRAGRWDLGCL